MNERFRTDEEIDRAIDLVARALASGEPHGGFARRVRAKLDERPNRYAISWWRLAMAASLAIVVLIGLMMRPPSLPAPVRSPAVSSGPAPLTIPSASRVEPSRHPPGVETVTSPRLRIVPDAPGILPLAEPVPIAVVVSPPAEIGFKEPELGLTELTLGGLEVAPLDTAKEPR